MNKKYLSGFVILIAFLIIVPGIAGAPKIDNMASSSPGYQNITPCDASKLLEQNDVFIVDVRTPAEYRHGHLEGAKLIPLKNMPAYDPVNLSDSKLLPNRIDELPEDKNTKILVYCKTGGRGSNASQLIADECYKSVYNMQGGINSWVSAGCPIVVNPEEWTASYPSNPSLSL